ncbi:hypothetical protein EV183_005587 [Coemansia sp. RSA 2336]|nr:hypothetical protein EV183_005587 [Coemansia sp. RSA 2336]
MAVPELNTDIIHKILSFSAQRVDREWKEWRQTLPLLWVSSAWRQAGIKRWYSHAHMVCKGTSRKRPTHSNIALAVENGYGSLVAKLTIVYHKRWDHLTNHIAETVGATESNCKGLTMAIGGMPMCDSNGCICHCYRSAKSWNTRSDVNIFKDIVVKYQVQLTQVDRAIRLCIVYPESLRRLKVKNGGFELASSFDALEEMHLLASSFDALEEMHLVNVASSSFRLLYSLEDMQRKCPRLKRIKLNDTVLALDGA